MSRLNHARRPPAPTTPDSRSPSDPCLVRAEHDWIRPSRNALAATDEVLVALTALAITHDIAMTDGWADAVHALPPAGPEGTGQFRPA